MDQRDLDNSLAEYSGVGKEVCEFLHRKGFIYE